MNTIELTNSHKHILYCTHCKNALLKKNDAYFCPNCSRSYPIVDGIPSFIDRNATIDSFDASFFEFLFKMEQNHFWHIGRKEIILDVLKRNIPSLSKSRMLEIGCGNGSVLAYLKQNGINIEGGDIFFEGLQFCRQRFGPEALYQLDILELPFRENIDIIGIFDILEHIDNDERAIIEINQALKPGGNLILTVPANKFLWSDFDVQSHHKRRYSKTEIATKLERHGFTVKKISFYMFFLFPLLAAIRLISNITQSGEVKRDIKASLEVQTLPVINGIFLLLLRIEKWLLRYVSLPFGASLLVWAEKKGY